MKTGELKIALQAKRESARQKHERGGGGFEISHELSSIVDDVIIDLYDSDKDQFNGVLAAIGGYGRGLLNPYSDVDLLFLLNDSLRKKTYRPPETMLARLWDLGLKVGHSARTISDSVTIGRSDLYSRTSMMESRFLAGDRDLYDLFRKKYTREVVRYKPDFFIKEKMEEMRKRHLANGIVMRLTEPNLKESKGGLRDLHTAMWITRAKHDAVSIEDMAARGMIDPDDVEPVNNAHSFLLRLRNSLHWRAGGPSDIMAHELQPDIARLEHFDGSDNVAAAELMRRYYEAGQVITRFAEELISFSKTYRKKWRWRPIAIDDDGLFTDGDKLYAHSFPPENFEDEPELLLRIARRLSNEALEPAPNLKRGLTKVCQRAPDGWFTGEKGGRLIISTLKLGHCAKAIKAFYQAGILARLIPEFEAVTNLSQFDMFHRYSVDEHTIMTLANLEKVPEGAPVCLEFLHIFRAQPKLEIIKLALLLHDLGKRAEDYHAVEEDTRTPVILKRLALDDLIEPVTFLVKNHLLMSETAQRRNFTAPEALRRFCNEVGNQTNLKRLYLLTFADIASVGPDIWNDWKDKILLDLYEEAEKYFIEGESFFLSRPERHEALMKGIIETDELKHTNQEVESFLSRAPLRYLRTATPEMIVEHLNLLDRSKTQKVALRFVLNPGDRTGEITLMSLERIGFFSVIAGALTAKNVNIIETQIHTFEGHMALDSIVVEGANLSFFADFESLTKFEKELGDLLEGKIDVAEQVARRMRYMDTGPVSKTFSAEPQVLLLNHLSDTNTIVEIWAPDRQGLLYDITRTMAELNLDIESAKISTEGKLAINVFYVTEETGEKIESEERIEKVTKSLLSVINV